MILWIRMGIVAAIIVGCFSLLALLITLKRDSPKIDKIKEDTSSVSIIKDVTIESRNHIAKDILPLIDKIKRIDDIVLHFKIQDAIRDEVSGDINKDYIVQGIEAVYKKNALLNEKLKSVQNENHELQASVHVLENKNEELEKELGQTHHQKCSKNSSDRTDYYG